ncbi:hypothetical protein PV11_02740 [Exophiala sideris]|uniref:Epoxide hydrolase N-terminal domain-containing protein n=1 Tax=Exophiala sideris TaxID=1016849 RepID=A0A0D1WEE8_9EURO|nr:hypothetical protein PV11_02740 [Exophiala sideris]
MNTVHFYLQETKDNAIALHFQISIPDDELDLLKQKLRLARLPKTRKGADQGEDNGVTASFMKISLTSGAPSMTGDQRKPV